jgi:DNA-binding transcriptional ArsR family regulator
MSARNIDIIPIDALPLSGSAAPSGAEADPLLCEKKCVHPESVLSARGSLPGPRELLAVAEFFKVFGDQTRLSLLSALRQGELCVCDLARTLDMSDSAVSHQLAVLRRSGLILPRRDGKIVYYRLADAHVETIIDFAFEHLRENRP